MAKSRPTRGAWIEIILCSKNQHAAESRPTRGAWIEISHWLQTGGGVEVAPHTGRVD